MNATLAFPPEVIVEIFKWNVPRMLVRVTHVCRRWRTIGLESSELWRTVVIVPRDADRLDMVAAVLQRSKERTISLTIDFGEGRALDERAARWNLLTVVCKHIHRTRELSVAMDWEGWVSMMVQFSEERYESLVALDLRMVRPTILRTVIGEVLELPAFPLPFPAGHPLRRITLSGMEVEDVALPQLTDIRIIDHVSRLRSWLTHATAERLSLEDFRVPTRFESLPRNLLLQPPPWITPITHLTLARLRATRHTLSGYPGEDSCVHFFRHLQTPHLRVLEILDWRTPGRAWGDFLVALFTTRDKFPCLSILRIRGMHFIGMTYAAVHRFLASFPALESLSLEHCFPGTWQIVVEVLQLDRALCTELREVYLEDGFVVGRDDPLPFRNAMLLRAV
ncbi:hypothetical protein FB451DRAFT_1177050 [Mycena latifolia]|nr:hypothetical protein FB451DRAFT_1177050 [Mycena latifolia]